MKIGSGKIRIWTWVTLTLECITLFIEYAAAAAPAKTLQSGPTLCNPIDGSPPGSSVPGILQARTLEWDAISFSNRNKANLWFKNRKLVLRSRYHLIKHIGINWEGNEECCYVKSRSKLNWNADFCFWLWQPGCFRPLFSMTMLREFGWKKKKQ